jgi:restriction system protein
MHPILDILRDGAEWHVSDVVKACTGRLPLTADECNQMMPSGKRAVVHDRIAWALTYLRKAGLLEQGRRGYSRITERGTLFFAVAPGVITTKDLAQFPEFVAFHARKPAVSDSSPQVQPLSVPEQTQTPGQQIEEAYAQLRAGLAEDLLERIKAMPPAFFEGLVVDLMLKLGYGGSRADAGKTLGQSGDGGVDGVIQEDALGLDQIYLQAKRWEGTVGRQTVQAFVGSLQGFNAEKGVMLTTSTFTREASEYARAIAKHVVLIDGERLANLMIDHGLGTNTETVYEIKRIDQEYFGAIQE